MSAHGLPPMETAALAPRPLTPFRFASLLRYPLLRHGITGRAPGRWRDGDISYTTGGDPALVLANRRAWAAQIGVDATQIVAVRQVHGNVVDCVDAGARGRGAFSLSAEEVPAADALLTDAPDTPLLLGFADCTPLLFHDPVRGVVGLAHAGWRGTVANVAGATVAAMSAQFGSLPGDITAGIGPAIGRCCYVVDAPVMSAWLALGVADPLVLEEIAPANGRRQWRFDLARANRLLLQRAGVPAAQIEDAALCTACNVASFPSHRAQQGQAGRFAAIISLAADDTPHA
ncbi:MAG TPA: peptidoglycan editing factor PgeF [Thermomicrobiales bacterium]|jgi:YfiH family protein